MVEKQPRTPEEYLNLFVTMIVVITIGITLLNQGAGLIAGGYLNKNPCEICCVGIERNANFTDFSCSELEESKKCPLTRAREELLNFSDLNLTY